MAIWNRINNDDAQTTNNPKIEQCTYTKKFETNKSDANNIWLRYYFIYLLPILTGRHPVQDRC